MYIFVTILAETQSIYVLKSEENTEKRSRGKQYCIVRTNYVEGSSLCMPHLEDTLEEAEANDWAADCPTEEVLPMSSEFLKY